MTISVFPHPAQEVFLSNNASSQLDSFGRLKVASPNTLFDSQQEYGLDTLRLWDATANGTLSIATGSTNGSVTDGLGNLVGPRDSNTRLTPITCSSTNGHYSVLQSRMYVRYIPANGHMVFMTGIFASGANTTNSVVIRSSTSGSVVDTVIPQSSWNYDKFDGTGPSGVTLDFTKTQILFIDAQWLGVGGVMFGFEVDGCLCIAHKQYNTNIMSVPYTQTFNLPTRMDIRTSGTTTIARSGYFDHANGVFLQCVSSVAGGTIKFNCCSVQSSGGEESLGFPISASNGITTIGVTTRRPVLSIRPKTTYNGLDNRSLIRLAEMALTASTNNAYWELVVGGTLTGAVFASVDSTSITEFDVAASSISGGVTVAAGYVLTGSGAARGQTSGLVGLRGPLCLSKIDALAATQINVSLVCTSFTGTSNISAMMHWHEQVV